MVRKPWPLGEASHRCSNPQSELRGGPRQDEEGRKEAGGGGEMEELLQSAHLYRWFRLPL